MSLSNSLPLSTGIGLKPQHFADALQATAELSWIEVHPENYLMAGGPLLQGLMQIRKNFQLSLHSVGMSPGSAGGINVQHVRRLKALCERVQPSLVSDHLAWTHWQQQSLNDLLPIPYSENALTITSNNIDLIQTILGRTIAIENPSLYLSLPSTDMDEAEFLTQLVQRTGCSLLLDINNLVVNACNVDLDVHRYLRNIPRAAVVEYHLAGHKVEEHLNGKLCIDDHGSAVSAEVWQLYQDALQIIGPRPTLLEWDTNVPAFSVLQAEASKATPLLTSHGNKERRDG